MKITALKTSDPRSTFAQVGFNLSNDEVISLNDVDIIFDESQGSHAGLISWGWSELPEGVTEVAGIPAFVWEKRKVDDESSHHKNTVVSVDHIVLHTNNKDKIKAKLRALGMEPRRERSDIYPDMTQIFYRPGNGPILEVVANDHFSDVNYLWGATLVVEDMKCAKKELGNYATEPKSALQPGRKIMTLRHDSLHFRTNMAFMTPHVKAPAASL